MNLQVFFLTVCVAVAFSSPIELEEKLRTLFADEKELSLKGLGVSTRGTGTGSLLTKTEKSTILKLHRQARSTGYLDKSVASWVNEKKDYDYASNSCSGVCGHYTQVVWADSTKLGCAVGSCPSMTNLPSYFRNVKFVVCNYGPGGNFNGRKPYEEGTAASNDNGSSGTASNDNGSEGTASNDNGSSGTASGCK
ncbi:unnamed protein product [Mytilus edulis]|uniref:SCP domain-containing protein n=1 Tax=Mytilus edulis TaxID=6550 RepID=A0A8S3S5H7_MYTED|nr:unnamed protein product [Mytilus edulis]